MNYSLIRATTWNLAGYLYLILASFFSIPILINSLGLATFSQYALILATLTIASSIDLGLSSAVIRKLSRDDHSSHHSVWSTSLFLFFVTGVIAASIATIIVSQLNISFILLPIVFVHTLTSHILAHYLTLPQAHGRFDLYNTRTFLVGTANTFASSLLAHYGYGIDVLLIIQILASILTITILAHYSHHYFYLPPVRPSRTLSRELLSFGLKNQVGKLMGQIGAQYAKFLLVSVSALAVSAYSVGQGIVLKLAGSLTQLATAAYPVASRKNNSPRLRTLYHRLQLSLVFLSLFGIVIYSLFGLLFLTWWLTEPTLVQAVHKILSILVPYLAILTLTPLASTILDSHNRPGTTSIFATITILIEIVIAIFLLPTHGLLAPPIAALISVSLTTPALLIVTERTLRKVE